MAEIRLAPVKLPPVPDPTVKLGTLAFPVEVNVPAIWTCPTLALFAIVNMLATPLAVNNKLPPDDATLILEAPLVNGNEADAPGAVANEPFPYRTLLALPSDDLNSDPEDTVQLPVSVPVLLVEPVVTVRLLPDID